MDYIFLTQYCLRVEKTFFNNKKIKYQSKNMSSLEQKILKLMYKGKLQKWCSTTSNFKPNYQTHKKTVNKEMYRKFLNKMLVKILEKKEN